MVRMLTNRVVLTFAVLFLFLFLACGGEATPAAAPAATPDPADTQALVQQAIEEAVAQFPAPDSGTVVDQEAIVKQAVQAAVAAIPAPLPGAVGPSAADIAAQVQEAISASVPAGTSPDEIRAMVESVVSSAIPAQPTPVATTPAAPAMALPSGRLAFSVTELGAPQFVLQNEDYQNYKFAGTVTHEQMFASDVEGARIPRLVKQLDVDSSGLIYTFHLQEGVTFHKNWGEFTADDFLFTINSVTQTGSVHTSTGDINRLYLCDECELTKIDDYTVRLKRPSPTFEIAWRSWHPEPGMEFHSKLQFDTLGEDQANRESAGTGPWNMVDYKSGEFRLMEAVQDHWRKTPEFAEMIWYDIAEESTRVANFMVGRLDTALFSADSLQEIRNDPPEGVKYMTLPNAAMIRLMPTGQQYLPDFEPRLAGEIDNPLGSDAGDCSPAYISCDRDESSPEWQKALKVRQALNHAVDRQKLINNIAQGEGQPVYNVAWMGHEARLKQFGLDKLEYEYDLGKAKQLLVDAGYPGGGFDIDMCLVHRPGLAAEAIAAGQAVATMWEEIGVTAKQEIMPHSAFFPKLVARTARCYYARSDDPQLEPLRNWNSVWNARNPGYNQGLEHPTLQRLLDEAALLMDDEKRWAKQAEIARWFFDNATDLPLYTKPQIFPLGKRLDTWPVMPRITDWLNNWEYAKHRQ